MSLPAGMQEDHVVTIRDTERPEMKEEFSRSSESPSASFESTGGDDGAHRKGVLSGVQSLEWNVDSYVVGRADKQKTILRNITGRTNVGEVTAILGPSGCGKTSLLQCIALRSRQWTGGVAMNGQSPGGEYYNITGFVHQFEDLLPFLTVREHLVWQATARMSRSNSKHTIMKRVEEVIREARLEKCADTILGGNNAFFVKRGISGGEKKRVAIATELLKCPNILFLDEPTSGLDSVMSRAVISLLSDLAAGGRMVLASVHCPSSDSMRMFTHVLLLTHDGRLAYHGPRSAAVANFTALGYKYPVDYNPADYLLDVLSYDPDNESASESARIDSVVKAFASTPYRIQNPLPCTSDHKSMKRIHSSGSTSWTLWKLNLWRFGLSARRDKFNLVLYCVLHIVVGVIFGLLFLNQMSESWRNLMGMTFSLAVTGTLIALLGEMMRWPSEWGPLSRELYSGTNAVGPILFSHDVIAGTFMFGPMLMVSVAYWMMGLDPNPWAFFKFLGVYAACNMASTSLGMLVASFHSSLSVAMTLLPVVATPMILFSGLLYQRGTAPAYLAWIEKISIVNYTFSAMLVQQSPILHNGAGSVLLDFLQVKPSELSRDVSMLLVLFVGFRLVQYVVITARIQLKSEAG